MEQDGGDQHPVQRWQRLPKFCDCECPVDSQVWMCVKPQRRFVHYAPDRGPPIFDFLSIFAAFVVAVIAAYYTITY